MSEGRPWWFSEDEATSPPKLGFDISSLAGGAQQMVEWARSIIVAPHAAHTDPREHPQCVMCQAERVFADGPQPPVREHAIAWIDIDWQ